MKKIVYIVFLLISISLFSNEEGLIDSRKVKKKDGVYYVEEKMEKIEIAEGIFIETGRKEPVPFTGKTVYSYTRSDVKEYEEYKNGIKVGEFKQVYIPTGEVIGYGKYDEEGSPIGLWVSPNENDHYYAVNDEELSYTYDFISAREFKKTSYNDNVRIEEIGKAQYIGDRQSISSISSSKFIFMNNNFGQTVQVDIDEEGVVSTIYFRDRKYDSDSEIKNFNLSFYLNSPILYEDFKKIILEKKDIDNSYLIDLYVTNNNFEKFIKNLEIFKKMINNFDDLDDFSEEDKEIMKNSIKFNEGEITGVIADIDINNSSYRFSYFSNEFSITKQYHDKKISYKI